MTDDKKCFIYLISCFLNRRPPESVEPDWKALYRLAEIHDVTAIISSQIKLLPVDKRPTGELRSLFNQRLGYTVKNFEIRRSVFSYLKELLNRNKIDYLPVKGSVINSLYPSPELRTCGDIDIIVREDSYYESIELLKGEGITFYEPLGSVTASFDLNGINVELHRYHDVLSDYFNDIFSLCDKTGEFEYSLNEYDTLLYVLCHLAKHLTQNGAGIRMLADIDVIIRSIDGFDENCFYSLCEKAGFLKTAQILLSTCNAWFDTPVSQLVDVSEGTELSDMLERVILDGGSFGFENGGLADYHIVNNIGKSGRVTLFVKLKTLIKLLFPPKNYVVKYYEYLVKYPWLLPFAYLNRMFDAVFRRGAHSRKTVKGILDKDNAVSPQYQLLKEMEIELDYQ